MSDGLLPANNSTSNSSNNLPRGLMSKSGLPFNPNQRLPSLRSTLSKPSLLFQSSASLQITSLNSPSSTTKSPTSSKRNYESGSNDCLVTPRRQTTGEAKGFTNSTKQQGKNGIDSWKGSSPGSTSSGRGRRQNVRKTKKLIQLESTVFTGASRTPIKSSDLPNTKKTRSKKATISLPPPIQEQSDDSIEPAFIEGKLYQDDFINRSGDEDDNFEHLPQGWESLSLPITKESDNPSKSHWLTPDPLRDKLILFQLPKMLENKTNMKLGKLRIYESGKVELVNSLSDFTFEVTKVEQSKQAINSPTATSSTITIPSTSSGDDLNNGHIGVKSESVKLEYVEPKLNREVVTYSGRNLISIGKLESDAAIIVPKLLTNS